MLAFGHARLGLVEREHHGKKDPLAELVRLLEQDEDFRAVSRPRSDSSLNSRWSQPEEQQPARVPGSRPRPKLERKDTAALYGSQRDAGDASTLAPANYDRDNVPGDEENHGPNREDTGRQGRRVLAAAAALLALIITAGSFGYFAWVTGPRGSTPDSVIQLADAAHKWVGTKTSGPPAKTQSGEGAIPDKGTSVEPATAPLTIPSAQVFRREPDPGAIAEFKPIDTRPRPPSGDEQPTNRAVVPSDEVARAPNQDIEPSTGPTDTAPAEERAKTAMTKRAPAAPAKPPKVEPSGAPSAVSPGTIPSQGYTVQLSSQRSEKAAQATLQALQGKYQTMFGDRQPFIRRSDLGVKGVYFRVMLGPFGSFQEANQFCADVKKADGDCVVQKN